ncbi:MAG: cyclic nucleotide-binding domain-containing protein, partial [Pseudomonadota bacterium]
SWQPRFLASPLMQRLPPAAWQRVLRAMTLEAHAAGARIVTAGEAATCCYVLCSGAAEIRCSGDGAPVALLEPGNLFGEDALVTGRGRNASVVMTGPGATVSLSAEHFRRWLLDPVIRPLPSPAGCCVIDLDAPPPIPRPGHVYLEPGEVRRAARMLSAGETYAIVGGRLSERYLAAFLLAERDIDARPVCEGAAGGGA